MTLKTAQTLFRAFADETRLRILNLLEPGELCVCDCMRVLNQPQSKISRHLAYLRQAELVSGRKQGLWMYYRLTEKGLHALHFFKQGLSPEKNLPDEFANDRETLTRIPKKSPPCCDSSELK